VRLKNTGIAAKLGLSAAMPVGIGRPVFGHLIITSPTTISLTVHVNTFSRGARFSGHQPGSRQRQGAYLEFASVCDMPAAIGFAASAATFQYSAHNSPVRLDIALSCLGAWVVHTSITSGNDRAAMSSRYQS
jgi:hypothetical protein